MGRSEKLIESRDSWFSPKCIEVQPRVVAAGGRALFGLGGLKASKPRQTPNTGKRSPGVSLRAIKS